MTLTRAEIADHLQRRRRFDPVTAKLFVDNFFESISRSLEDGKDVKITGFGNFELRLKNARPGRNPKTGEAVEVSARRVVTFKPGGKIRLRLKNER